MLISLAIVFSNLLFGQDSPTVAPPGDQEAIWSRFAEVAEKYSSNFSFNREEIVEKKGKRETHLLTVFVKDADNMIVFLDTKPFKTKLVISPQEAWLSYSTPQVIIQYPDLKGISQVCRNELFFKMNLDELKKNWTPQFSEESGNWTFIFSHNSKPIKKTFLANPGEKTFSKMSVEWKGGLFEFVYKDQKFGPFNETGFKKPKDFRMISCPEIQEGNITIRDCIGNKFLKKLTMALLFGDSNSRKKKNSKNESLTEETSGEEPAQGR